MKRAILTDLIGKEIRITDFYIKNSMKSKSDTANVEFELDGEKYYFTTTSPYVIYQLTWIKQCLLDYKLNKRTKGIVHVRMNNSNPSMQSIIDKVVDKMMNHTIPDNTAQSYIIFSDDTCDAKERDNLYLTFYNDSIYVKIIRQKNSIYFSFTLSDKFMIKLSKEEDKRYENRTKEMLSKGDIKYKYFDK